MNKRGSCVRPPCRLVSCVACVERCANPSVALALPATRRVCATQFYDKGCENCPKLDMEGNRPRIEECTTTHFNGCALRRAARLLAL